MLVVGYSGLQRLLAIRKYCEYGKLSMGKVVAWWWRTEYMFDVGHSLGQRSGVGHKRTMKGLMV